MKRTIALCAILGLLLGLAHSAAAEPQLRGKKLYDEWAKLDLVKTTGTQRVTWLPEGIGWLETETDKAAGTTTFFKVDALTQKKDRLFDPETEKSLVTEYNKLNFKNLAGLPFTAFAYLPENRGIRFTVAESEFVYFFKERLLRKLERPAGMAAPTEAAVQRSGGLGAPPSPQGFSPDFTKFVYSKNYNLWMFDSASKKEEPITFGGVEELMSGKTDWV